MSVKRYDRGELRKPKKLANGMLRVDAFITRTGVFEYLTPDGKTRQEYRPPGEVFHADSLESFQLCPLTLDHPSEAVTLENVAKYSVGHLGDTIRQDGDRLVATVMVSRSTAIAALEARTHAEVSCGYVCDMDETPGTTPDGLRYDAIQRNIRGNHVALVPQGRAGPEVRVRLDAADAVMTDTGEPASPNTTEKDAPTMKKIRVDGVEVEVSETAEQLLAKRETAHEARFAALESKVATLTKEKEEAAGALDQSKAELAQVKTDMADATDPVKIQARVDARTALVARVLPVLGTETKLDGMPDLDVKKAMLTKLFKGLDLKDRSEDYINGRFEAAIEGMLKTDAKDNAGRGMLGIRRVVTDGVDPVAKLDAAASRAKMIADAQAAWKPRAK